MAAQSPADTRMMGILHAAFRRDLARVRLVLTATPVSRGARRQAVADQVSWLMQRLHEHHQTEDEGLWPLVRRHNPAAAGLLQAMEAEHAR
jgi:iron-sulfur cluster repair protein YtfE (RIC family)